jgi:hypothetical protein
MALFKFNMNSKTRQIQIYGALLVALYLATPIAAQLCIRGQVTIEDDQPAAGAKVWIQTAAPREGRGYL